MCKDGGVEMAVTLVRVNGVGKVNGKVPRKVLERNVLDMMTMDPEADFEEALEKVEEMSLQELIEYLKEEGEKYESFEEGNCMRIREGWKVKIEDIGPLATCTKAGSREIEIELEGVKMMIPTSICRVAERGAV